MSGDGVFVFEAGDADFAVGDATFPEGGGQVVSGQAALFDVGVGVIAASVGGMAGDFGDDEIVGVGAGLAAGAGQVGGDGGQGLPVEAEGVGVYGSRPAIPDAARGPVGGRQPSPRARKISLAASMAARVKGMPP